VGAEHPVAPKRRPASSPSPPSPSSRMRASSLSESLGRAVITVLLLPLLAIAWTYLFETVEDATGTRGLTSPSLGDICDTGIKEDELDTKHFPDSIAESLNQNCTNAAQKTQMAFPYFSRVAEAAYTEVKDGVGAQVITADNEPTMPLVLLFVGPAERVNAWTTCTQQQVSAIGLKVYDDWSEASDVSNDDSWFEKQRSRLTQWKDECEFGFIVPPKLHSLSIKVLEQWAMGPADQTSKRDDETCSPRRSFLHRLDVPEKDYPSEEVTTKQQHLDLCSHALDRFLQEKGVEELEAHGSARVALKRRLGQGTKCIAV
jgi:hypothetical protein